MVQTSKYLRAGFHLALQLHTATVAVSSGPWRARNGAARAAGGSCNPRRLLQSIQDLAGAPALHFLLMLPVVGRRALSPYAVKMTSTSQRLTAEARFTRAVVTPQSLPVR